MINVLVTTYWSFNDALIQTYTLPYVKIMLANGVNEVTLLTLEKNGKIDKSIIEKYKKDKINIISFPYNHISFKMYLKLMWFIMYLVYYTFKNKINYIHGWCTPGGAIAYLISLITRKKLILDSFEPHAEIMSESNTWNKNGLAFRILFLLEKLQVKRAKQVIACTFSMKNYTKEKYNYNILDNRFHVKPACIDLQQFSFNNVKKNELLQELEFENKIICVYAGKFGGSYLEKEIFQIFKVAHVKWGSRFKVLLLNNQNEDYLKKIAKKVDFDYLLVTKLFISHDEIPNYIGLADFALTPFIPVPSKRHGTPIKNGEYWALGLPVIITKNISDDSYIINKNDIGYELQGLNNTEYTKSIEKINKIIEGKEKIDIYNKIRPFAEKYRNYKIAERVYQQIYGENKINNKC